MTPAASWTRSWTRLASGRPWTARGPATISSCPLPFPLLTTTTAKNRALTPTLTLALALATTTARSRALPVRGIGGVETLTLTLALTLALTTTTAESRALTPTLTLTLTLTLPLITTIAKNRALPVRGIGGVEAGGALRPAPPPLWAGLPAHREVEGRWVSGPSPGPPPPTSTVSCRSPPGTSGTNGGMCAAPRRAAFFSSAGRVARGGTGTRPTSTPVFVLPRHPLPTPTAGRPSPPERQREGGGAPTARRPAKPSLSAACLAAGGRPTTGPATPRPRAR